MNNETEIELLKAIRRNGKSILHLYTLMALLCGATIAICVGVGLLAWALG